VLPVDDDGLEVSPAGRDEVLYASAEPRRLGARMTIERLARSPLILYDARYGWSDPTRRQLAERAQRAGVRLEPDIEVEEVESALDMAARGLGDTVVARFVTLGPRFPRRLGTVGFADPVYDTFAFIWRRGARLSPAARAFVEISGRRLERLGRRAGMGD
jgi:DNA-binding transcriptional LysR family regulator